MADVKTILAFVTQGVAMTEIADKFRAQHMIANVRAMGDWEHEAQLLGSREYEALKFSLAALAAAVDLLTPALPNELQP
jgi:hypothetical protein